MSDYAACTVQKWENLNAHQYKLVTGIETIERGAAVAQIHLRIADLRRQRKVTQQELADQVGVSYQTVSRWETGAGEPELSLLAVLAEYFHWRFKS